MVAAQERPVSSLPKARIGVGVVEGSANFAGRLRKLLWVLATFPPVKLEAHSPPVASVQLARLPGDC